MDAKDSQNRMNLDDRASSGSSSPEVQQRLSDDQLGDVGGGHTGPLVPCRGHYSYSEACNGCSFLNTSWIQEPNSDTLRKVYYCSLAQHNI